MVATVKIMPANKLLAVCILVVVVGSTDFAQTAKTNLWTKTILDIPPTDCRDIDNNPISFNAESTITKQLYYLTDCLNVPVGIVYSNWMRTNQYRFRLGGQRSRDILDSIVSVAPGYGWHLEDGVVNLLPNKNGPPLLEYRLTEFHVAEASSINMLEALENNEAVRKRAAELGFDGPQIYVFTIGAFDNRKYNLTCRNCSIREVLNNISRLDGSSWMYAEYKGEGKKKYRFGFFTSLYAGL
jgi:hypothetical protein